ncbi:methyltransferase regulatory domain-containing protein [Dickeya chrysanthemi]|nr:methyltransferase regulatory domain-containing protein [Dickeya chrysanthemi]
MPDAQPLANNADMAEDNDTTPLSSMSPPIPHTAPFHLHATAHLYGIKSAIPETARVFEIGCKDGGNLLPFALANPQAQAVGVDLDAEQIEKGNALIKQLELENIALFALDLESLLACDPGTFDYIIIHGLFSLIGGETRDALLRFCRDHLTAEGIICYCYNTYPGWKTGEILRDAIQLHSSLANDDKTSQASARAMLTYLSLGTSPDNPQNAALKAFIEQAEKQSDVDFALHYLQGLNQPCYFVDFYSQITKAGFAYVGDVRAYTELAEHYGDQVSSLHETICPENTTYLRQQYLDFAVNRSQRFSMLVSQTNAEDIFSGPDLARLADFSWAGDFQRIQLDSGTILNAHLSGTGETISTENSLVLGMLDILGEAWPNSLTFDELVFNTQLPDKPMPDHRDRVLDALKKLFIKGCSGLYFRLGDCFYRRSVCEKISILSGLAETGFGFNFWHQPVHLSDEEKAILKNLGNNEQYREPDFYVKLFELRNKGVLCGAPRTWLKLMQKAIIHLDADKIPSYIQSFFLIAFGTDNNGKFNAFLNFKNNQRTNSYLDRGVYEKIDYLVDKSEFEKARKRVQEIIASYPDTPSCWYPFINVYLKSNDYDGALKLIVKSIAAGMFSLDICADIVVCFRRQGILYYGLSLARKILLRDETQAKVWDSLGVMLNAVQSLESAFSCMKKALELAPDNLAYISNMGMTCFNLGHKDTLFYQRKVVELAPDAFNLHSNYLLGASHSDEMTPEELYKAHLFFGERVEMVSRRYNCRFNYSTNKVTERPLRIGFISGDFGEHPVTNFLEPIWNALDRREFSLYAYSSFQRKDEKAASLKQTAAGWHDVDKMGDLEVATLINKDEIDILIDLSGHTAYNRLPALAMKPAPIQMTWIGYPGTTGMRAMDYILLYKEFIGYAGKLDEFLTEKPIYLPAVKFFEPNKDSPDVNVLPALSNGYLTFASFNRPQKISDENLVLWGRVLVALPNSRLIIGYMTGQETIDYFRSKLIELGVRDEQLSFRMRTGLSEYLKMHHEVDILLDTYPYTGGTTIGHASWMGVPVLTREGDSLASKQSAVIMRVLGLDEFIAQSDDELIVKAQHWSHSLDKLNKIRSEMRGVMAARINSVDSPSIYFEKAMRRAWEIYCAGERPHSFTIDK